MAGFQFILICYTLPGSVVQNPSEKRLLSYWNVGVTGVPLGVGGGEDSVNEHEGPYDLGPESNPGAVAGVELVGATAEPVVVRLLEGLDEPNATYGSQALSHHVQNRPYQRDFTSQEQPERHRRVYVTPCQ